VAAEIGRQILTLMPSQPELIVIGASLGGLSALKQILLGLSPDFTVPIAVAQHRYKDSDHEMIQFLQDATPLKVRNVEDKDPIAAGVHLAPADYHLLVESDYFSLSVDPPVSFARPSVDVLFESAADVYAERLVGIVLTGANHDGATGAAAVKANGGYVIVQTPTSAESPIMPIAALAKTKADAMLDLPEIAGHLHGLCWGA
jgi:two-component system, chemotaxis family, protein-glutamate methylesterase/glutaminase